MLEILQWVVPSGAVASIATWLIDRGLRRVRSAKEIHDTYKQMYEDVSASLVSLQQKHEETNEKLEQIENKQAELEKKIEELSLQEAIDVADSIKTQIFSFYHELQKPGIRHSEAEFNQIIALNEKYEKLVARTKQPNGVYEAEFKYIMQVFHQCQETNDFDLRGRKDA